MAISCEDYRKFYETNFEQEELEESSENFGVLDFNPRHDQWETYKLMVDIINQIESNIANNSNTVGSNKFHFYDLVDNVRLLIWDLIKNIIEAMTMANIPTDVYFTKMRDILIEMVEEAIQSIDYEKSSEDQTTNAQNSGMEKSESTIIKIKWVKKSKSMIIKIKWAKKYLEPIKAFMENISINNVSLLDENKILLFFKSHQDCKKFKLRLERIFPGIEIMEEQDDNVEIVIENIGNISHEDLECEIEKITHEKPEVIRIVELEKGNTWRAQVRLTGIAMLKLQTQSESTITIGTLKSGYYQVPDWAILMGYGREDCLNRVYP